MKKIETEESYAESLFYKNDIQSLQKVVAFYNVKIGKADEQAALVSDEYRHNLEIKINFYNNLFLVCYILGSILVATSYSRKAFIKYKTLPK